jgi:hypothetical protein
MLSLERHQHASFDSDHHTLRSSRIRVTLVLRSRASESVPSSAPTAERGSVGDRGSSTSQPPNTLVSNAEAKLHTTMVGVEDCEEVGVEVCEEAHRSRSMMRAFVRLVQLEHVDSRDAGAVS